MQPYLQAA